MSEETTMLDLEMIELEENFAFGSSVKKLQEELRTPVMVTSVTIIGNETFKGNDGKETTKFKIGVGFTSNAPHVSEGGEPVEGFHEFYAKFTATTNIKGSLMKSGLPDATGTKNAGDLKTLVNGLIGKKVSAMTKYRTYRTAQGEDRVAVELEKFKPLATEEDFSEVVKAQHIPFLAAKFSPDSKIITFVDAKPAIAVVSSFGVGAPADGGVKLSEIV